MFITKQLPYVLLTLFLNITIQQSNAQLPIERLDSFASEIRNIEHAAHDKIYNDGKKDYFVRFAEESFGFSYADGKAWKAVDKTNITTFTCITEDIDFSKAESMFIYFKEESATALLLYFPDSTIKTTVYTDDKEPYVLYENKLEFFFLTDTKNKPDVEYYAWEKLYYLLGDLVLRAQEAKGMVSRQDAIAQTEALKTINPPGFSVATHDDFLEKYPNSIYKLDVMQMKKQREKNWNFIVERASGAYGDKGQLQVYGKGQELILYSQGTEFPLTTTNGYKFYYAPQDINLHFEYFGDGDAILHAKIKGEYYELYKVKTKQ